MGKLVITRGIPASGKTTWSLQYVAQNRGAVRVSRDDIRRMLVGPSRMWSMDPEFEKQVTAIQVATVKQYLAKDMTVVIDSTNLKAREVKRWYDLCDDVEFKDFPMPVETALYRDRTRDYPVGEAVIRMFVQRYNADGKLPPPPERTHAAPLNVEPYIPWHAPGAYIFDIDGTLAHVVNGGRSHYDYSRVSEDTIDHYVYEVGYRLYRSGYQIILVSGREDSCRYDTECWLQDHGFPYNELLMRAAGDHRPDDVVKLEIFNKHIRTNYDVRGVFDDRDRVVKMWRSLGLKTFQVAEGDF